MEQRYLIEDSFRKLQFAVYYDNNNLILRSRLADFVKDGIDNKLALLEAKLGFYDHDTFSELYRNINLNFYPKKLVTADQTTTNKDNNHFITNESSDNQLISRLAIFCDMPIELHIICIMWILKYGWQLDNSLKSVCYGNRLILNDNTKDVSPGRPLFKKYMKQYQKWWSDGINKSNLLLKEKSDVTILNFDIQDYYHSVRIDFKDIENYLTTIDTNFTLDDPIHQSFKEIHYHYTNILKEYATASFKNSFSAQQVALPVGALSSAILANWYLNDFDEHIEKELLPIYYGRYVDDIMIVLRGKIGTNYKDIIKTKLKTIFEKSHVDGNDETYYINTNAKYRNLKLQEDKIFIYYFDSELPISIIEKFVEEQKTRSSEFRFLSDEEDKAFEKLRDSSTFDQLSFSSAMDNIDGDKARFKKIEENKFQISIYLAKMIHRVAHKGKSYRRDEINKIDKFFRGDTLIKNYNFWEKLLTLFVLYENKELVESLIIRIQNQIKNIKLELNNTITDESNKNIETLLKKSLNNTLLAAIEMALPYKPNVISKDYLPPRLDINRFRNSHFIRRSNFCIPLQEFTDIFIKKGLTDTSLINIKYIEKFDWVPYPIKFYEAYFAAFLICLIKNQECCKLDPTYFKKLDENFLYSKVILNEAFTIYSKINHCSDDVKDKIFYTVELSNNLDKTVRGSNPILTEVLAGENESTKGKYNIALVNLYVDKKNTINNLKNIKLTDDDKKQKVELYNRILDNIQLVENCDLFVQPEISLDFLNIMTYLRFSSSRQIGFVTGIEHLVYNNTAFNFVITCLPIKIDGFNDAIPVIRNKNHYAPQEILEIQKHRKVYPQVNNVRYDLFRWRGIYFATYYCFELANIIERSYFFSKIDMICAPIWNKDTLYYKNIVESMVRDLHCYFVQSNTSEFGDSRVTRPTSKDRKDKAIVKGGTTPNNPFVILATEIDIISLREFQKLDELGQHDLSSKFKPTPPGFCIDDVNKRIKNESFGEKISKTESQQE